MKVESEKDRECQKENIYEYPSLEAETYKR